MQEQHFDIFLSHNNKDKALVHELALRLHDEADIASWLDAWHIPTGSDWEKEIGRALDTCNVFVVFLGENGWSKYHLKESLAATERQKTDSNYRIIPVLLPSAKDADFAIGDELFTRLKLLLPDTEEFTFSELVNLFISKQRVDFRVPDGTDDDEAFQRLTTGISGKLPFPEGRVNASAIRRDALHWAEKGKKDKTILYRGTKLREAQKIVKESPERLNEHANQFLKASALDEQLSKRRQRNLVITLGGIAICAVIATSLAVAFGGQVGIAQLGEQQANETAQAESTARAEAQVKENVQRQIALARNLAEQSRRLGSPESQIFIGRNTPNGNRILATLLAIESIKRNPTAEGIQALITQLSSLPHIIAKQSFSIGGNSKIIMTSEDEKFAQIYLNPDQTKAIKVSQLNQTDYAIYVWRTSDWQETRMIDVVIPKETGLSYQPPIVISANTEWFAYISDNGVVLQSISNDSSQVLWETNGPFSALQFSLDSKNILAAKQDGSIKVWNVNKSQEIATILAPTGINFVSFNGSGDLLIVETSLIGDNRYDVLAYEIQSGKILTRFSNSSYLGTDSSGKYIAISFGDRYAPDNVHIWDVSSQVDVLELKNECLLDFIHGLDKIFTMLIGENGSCLSGLGNPVHIWDIKRKQQVYELKLDDLVWAGTITPDGEIAAISIGETVHILDIRKMELLTQATVGFISDTFVFSPDRSVVAIANRNPLPIADGKHSFNTVILDLTTGVEIGRIPHDNYIISMRFFDNSYISIADNQGNLIVWDIRDFWKNKNLDFQHDQPAAFPGSVASGRTFAVPVFSPDGQQLAIGGGNGNVETFELLSNQEIFVYKPTEVTSSSEIVYSPDGRWLAFTGLSCQLGSCPNNIKILSIESNTLFTIDPMEPVSFLAELAFSPDSRYLVINWRSQESQKNLLHIWDTNQWKRIRELKMDYDGLVHGNMTFNATGDRLILGSSGDNGKLSILTIPDWTQILEINSSVDLLTYNERNLLAIGYYDTTSTKATIRMFNTDTWKEVISFQHNSPLLAIAFNSSGEYLTAIDASQNLVTWETDTGRTISTRLIPDIGSTLIASPNYPSWFLMNAGNNILIVDIFTGTEIERIDTGELVRYLHISPDGKYIASGGADGKVQIWLWHPEDLIAEACLRLPRNMTQQEWKQYIGDEPYHPTCPSLPVPSK